MGEPNSTPHNIKIHWYDGTKDRPGSSGTYIVRLSQANRDSLNVKDGAYLKISYKEASVLGCLSVDKDLEDDQLLLDQTLRMAINLKGYLQSAEGKTEKGIYVDDPIEIQPSKEFAGPNRLSRLLNQQYLICVVHHALETDMEKPTIVRLTPYSLEALGVEPGDKVLLISDVGRVTVRCLSLNEKDVETLPTENMKKLQRVRTEESRKLPWILMDLQTRNLLNPTEDDDNDVKPWDTVIVSRHLPHSFTSELGTVAMGLALGALGGAVVLKDNSDWLPLSILGGSFLIVLILIAIKIRNKI